MKERRFKHYEFGSGCGVEACLEVIGGKWKGVILHHLGAEALKSNLNFTYGDSCRLLVLSRGGYSSAVNDKHGL